jgi:hypothetical protein
MSQDLTAIGDRMQSALSRIVEWVETPAPAPALPPYEVLNALNEGRRAVDDWTAARRETS